MQKLAFILLPVVLLAFAPAQDTSSSVEASIRAVLQRQQDAWNRRDLEAFMQGYWNSPELTFFSGDTVAHGWQSTLDRYRRKYQSAGAEMGKLEFSELQITGLAADAAFVRGRWQLTMPDGSQPHGLFTLVLRNLPDGWHIVHDHTSSS